MAMLHPDQYVYYNAFVGGVEGAQRKFKLDYWANSYAEAVQGLEDYLRAEYGADFEEREFTVAVCGPPISAGYYFPPNFRFVRERARRGFLYRLHQGQLRPFAARPAGLSGRAHGCAALGRAGSPRLSPSGGSRSGLGGKPSRPIPIAAGCPRRRRIDREWNAPSTTSSTGSKTGCGGSPPCTANLLMLSRRVPLEAASLPILDAGCGTGGLLARLAASYPERAVFGLDLDPQACTRAAVKSARPVCAGSVNELPFADGAFAAIFSADVLCHEGVDERRALRQFHRCLAEDGWLILNLPAYRWMLSRHDAAVRNVRRYTASGPSPLLQAVGFRPVYMSYWNALLFPLMVDHAQACSRRSRRRQRRQTVPSPGRTALPRRRRRSKPCCCGRACGYRSAARSSPSRQREARLDG